jgi:hypothetical protein
MSPNNLHEKQNTTSFLLEYISQDLLTTSPFLSTFCVHEGLNLLLLALTGNRKDGLGADGPFLTRVTRRSSGIRSGQLAGSVRSVVG